MRNTNLMSSLLFDKNFSNSPKSNIIKRDDDYLIQLVVPGFKKEDISIEIEDNYLIVESKKEHEENSELNYYHREFYIESFKEKFRLREVDSKKLEAKLEDGILNISIPKKEKKKPKKILIQ